MQKMRPSGLLGKRTGYFYLVTLLYWSSLYAYSSILPAYASDHGASPASLGVILGAYGLTQMLLRIPLGLLSDRLQKRRVFVVAGPLLAALAGLGLMRAQSAGGLLLFRAVSGAAASAWVVFITLFTAYGREDQAAAGIGVLNFFCTLGQTASVFLGGWVADRFGRGAAFALAAALGLAGALLATRVDEPRDREKNAPVLREAGRVMTNKTLLAAALLALVYQAITQATVYGFTPVYAVERLGMSDFDTGLLTLASAVPMALCTLLAAKVLLPRLGERTLIAVGFALTGLFTLCVPLVASKELLLLTQALAGAGRGLTFPVLMGLSAREIPARYRATAMGVFQAVYGLGMFLGPVLMGLSGNAFGLTVGFYAIGALSVAAALVVAGGGRR